jgi:hypothetical protein
LLLIVTFQTRANHLLIGVERTRKTSQSDTHLAVGDSNLGVARYNSGISLADV